MALDNAQTYQALEASQGYLANILESLPGGFIGVNAKNRITHCNSRAMEIFGFSSDLIGQHYSSALAGFPGLIHAIEATSADNQGAKRQVFTAQLPYKGLRQIGYSTLIIHDKHGHSQGIGISFQDITEFAHPE
jgi:PAS domain S-box-containing protein